MFGQWMIKDGNCLCQTYWKWAVRLLFEERVLKPLYRTKPVDILVGDIPSHLHFKTCYYFDQLFFTFNILVALFPDSNNPKQPSVAGKFEI